VDIFFRPEAKLLSESKQTPSPKQGKGDRFIYSKWSVPERHPAFTPERLKLLSKSINSIRRGYSPLHRFKEVFKGFLKTDLKTQQKVISLLEGGLIHSDKSVGILLSKEIYRVTNPSLKLADFILSRVPFWGTSYSLSDIKDIVCLLKKKPQGASKWAFR
jgi:hypothetical protein